MTVDDQTAGPDPSSKQRARLRMIGVIVLLLGLGSAGAVYWLGTRSADSSDDPSIAGYADATSRAESRQMGMLYGKMGVLTEDLCNALKRPGTQAIIIAAISMLIASGCFYFARPSGHGDEKH